MYLDYFYSCDDDQNKGKFKKGIGGTGGSQNGRNITENLFSVIELSTHTSSNLRLQRLLTINIQLL